MKNLVLIEVTQPIGTFYMGKLTARDLIQISTVNRLQEGKGVQRLLKPNRVKSISMFCSDPDMTFPTPIILAVDSNKMEIEKFEVPTNADTPNMMICSYDENESFAEILDGQHRASGIEMAAREDVSMYDVDLPVIVMFDLNMEQKAYVFSTINGNQEAVPPSVIYELFELSKRRSPYKTCHEIARALNSNESSPFYRRLKMMEKKIYSTESITQNAFVSNLCDYLISKDPQYDGICIKKGLQLPENSDLAFRKYFIKEKDTVILKILINYFSAAKRVFPNEWDDTKNFILVKTVGFSGLMKALNRIVPMGEKQGKLNEDFFYKIFKEFKKDLIAQSKRLVVDDFPSSGAGSTILSNMIVKSAEKVCR